MAPEKMYGARLRGFTLIELLVVIAIIAILATLLLPALSRAKQQAQGVHCLNSMKQVQLAWLMYAHDANDTLPGNDWNYEKGYASYTGNQSSVNWVSGWEQAGFADTQDNTNTDLLTNPKYAQIGPYLKNPKIYICSASRILCQEVGGAMPLVRDISMSEFMGSSGYIPVLGANYYCREEGDDSTAGYQVFTKLSQMQGATPGSGVVFSPSAALVFIDEKDDSIDDGEFLIEMVDAANGPEMANIPASYHAGAGLVSFADGHAVMHKWSSRTVLLPPQQAGVATWSSRPDNFKAMSVEGDTIASFGKDEGWLQKHASFSTQYGTVPYFVQYSPPN